MPNKCQMPNTSVSDFTFLHSISTLLTQVLEAQTLFRGILNRALSNFITHSVVRNSVLGISLWDTHTCRHFTKGFRVKCQPFVMPMERVTLGVQCQTLLQGWTHWLELNLWPSGLREGLFNAQAIPMPVWYGSTVMMRTHWKRCCRTDTGSLTPGCMGWPAGPGSPGFPGTPGSPSNPGGPSAPCGLSKHSSVRLRD